jgi:phage terminase small subunit
MAGVKGRSGGPRANSGGARPGAGRPKKAPPAPLQIATDDPLKFLLGVMQDMSQDSRTRVRAAIAAAQYMHPKAGDGGKKEGKADAAKKVSAGKFAPAAPPRAQTVN